MNQLHEEQEEERQMENQQQGRKKQFRWKLNHDQALVTAVFLEHQPFKDGQAGTTWTKVAESVNLLFNSSHDKVSVHRRFDIVFAAHRKEETKNRYRSGEEEEVGELINKLNDLISLIDDQKLLDKADTEAKQKKIDDSKANADEVRQAACSTIKTKLLSPETAPPPKKRVTDSTLIDLWKEKQEEDQERLAKKAEDDKILQQLDRESKDKEFDLQQKRLALQEQQFELEKLRFEHQCSKDREEMRMRERLQQVQEDERKQQIATQNALLQMLMKKLK